MFYKWDENTTLKFLNIYRKYPCLWNPHHVKYYDCSAKNKALKNVIKKLNLPGLNVFDCLEQIKVIREKYGHEQIRIIGGLQLQRPYKSPFAWFPIIAEMLTKVINDEDKLQSGTRPLKMSIESRILKNCITPCNRYEELLNLPCTNTKIKRHDFKNLQEVKRDFKTLKARRNKKFTKTGYTPGDPNQLDYKSKRKYDSWSGFLQCPQSCGWEEIDTHYENCFLRYRTRDDETKYNNIMSYPNFLGDLQNFSNACYPQNTRDFIDQHTMQTATSTSKVEVCTKETRLLDGQKSTKQTGSLVKHRNKKIQNTICKSKLNATLPSSKCVTTLNGSNYVEVDSLQRSDKKNQSTPLLSSEDSKHIAVNNVRCDRGIENTFCVSQIDLNNCQKVKKDFSVTKMSEQINKITVKCPANDMRNIIGIKFKNVGCSMSNFVLITTDGKYIPLIQTDFKSKKLQTDKDADDSCRNKNNAIDIILKKVKCPSTLNDKTFLENKVYVKESCSCETMKIVNYNSIAMQILLQCLEKITSLCGKTKTRSATLISSKKDYVEDNSSEGNICEPCVYNYKFTNKDVNLTTNSITELNTPDCLTCSEEIEKYNVINVLTETFLEIMKYPIVSDNRRHIDNVQEKYAKEENVINAFDILRQIKKCADAILKIYTIKNCSKKLPSNKSCFRYKSKDKCYAKTDINSRSIQTQSTRNVGSITNERAITDANLNDIKLLHESSRIKTGNHGTSKNSTIAVNKATEKKPSVEDKQITANSEKHDIGLNVSLPKISLHDSSTQYIAKQLQDTGVVTEHEKDFEEKINAGTQKSEPILLCITKGNNSKEILKLNKETCIRNVHITWRRNVDKCIETCPVLQYIPQSRYPRKRLFRKYYNEGCPDLSYIGEKEVKLVDYHMSLSSNKNYKYEKECKIPLSYNQSRSKVNVSSHRYISKIPLYTGTPKYVRRTNDRMSRSYI